MRHTLCGAVTIVVMLLSAGRARGVDPATLRLYQASQLGAREMARELVGEVLDSQLEQLDINELTDLPVYREILSMRRNIDDLVDNAMPGVVALLARAQQETGDDRDKLFSEARARIREIVKTLAAERQKVLQRMRRAQVIVQTERLIAMQSDTLKLTGSLPGIADLEMREDEAVRAVRSQRDINTLYLHLVDELSVVSGWGPSSGGPAAADGLRMLRAHRVKDHLIAALRLLESVGYKESAAEQKAVIEGLSAVLYQVGKGSVSSRLNIARLLRIVADLQERQQRLHDQTQKAKKADAAQRARLAESQRDIHRDIGVLADQLTFLPAAGPHLETAKASALKAADAIRAGRFAQAINPQKSVMTSLTGVESLLRAAGRGRPGKSADQLMAEAEAMMGLDTALTRIRAQHDQAEAQVIGSPASAAALEKRVADDLGAEQGKYQSLPEIVTARLENARSTALDAVKRIPAGPVEAQSAVKATGLALDHAHAEVKSALADTRRRALGVKIGELARAIDALERASVAERAQAERAIIAAADGGFDKDAAKKFTDEQQTVANVVRAVADAVKQTAPGSLEKLGEAEVLVDRARSSVEQDRGAAGALKAAKEADRASKLLAEATKLIRGQIVQTADRLHDEASKELAAVSKIADRLDETLAKARDSAAHRLARLEEAEQKVLMAQAEQLRAAGQKQAAQAADLINRINRTGAQQAAASAAIGRFESGEANTPLDAVNELQKSADLADEMTKAAAKRPQALEAQRRQRIEPLTESLHELRQATYAAIKAMLESNAAAAKVASEAARKALESAAAQAKTEAAAARQDAAGPLDAPAQQRVTGAAKSAAQLTAQAAPPIAGQLREASDKSDRAAKQIQAKSDAEARKTQAEVAELLKRSEQQIEAAKQRLAEQGRQELAKQGAEAAKLAAQARSVDPTASTALKRASQAARRKAKPPAQASARQASQAAAEVQKNLAQAAANLQSRKQELERQRDLAEIFKRLAQQQQSARDDLVALGPQLSNPPQGREVPSQTQAGPKDQPRAPEGQAGRAQQPAPAQPESSKQQGQGSEPVTQPQLQKGGSPQAPSPPGQSGLAPPGQQQPQPQQPQMPFSDKKDDLNKAKQLTSALGDYIGSQEDLGDLAERLSKQKKIANESLKEALKQAAKLNPNLDRAPNQMFIPPPVQPVFEPSKKPRLPEQIAGSGAMPQQARKEKGETEGAIVIPPQTQGPQNPPSTSGQAKDMNNPQVQSPPEEGPNASTTVQTAPITSAPQPAAPPSAPGVFQPNEGKPKSATPSSRTSPPPPGKGPKPQVIPKEDLDKFLAEWEKQKKQKRKRIVRRPSEQKQPKPPAPLGDEFKPLSPEETAVQLAGKDAVEEAVSRLKKHGQLGEKEKELLADDEQEEEVEIVEEAAQAAQQQEPGEQPGETGTTPGDLGMGQGTPGKGVGGESTGSPTEQRPQKGNQHGRFDGKRPWAKAPDDVVPKGLPFPPGFKPELKPAEPKDPFAAPEDKGEPPVAMPDVDPNAPADFGGGKGGRTAAGRRTRDVKLRPRDYDGQPWFAKLPPELRAAIQSTSKSRPPRGYEEKLRRYRESVD